MGYRHSWSRPKSINRKLWRGIARDFEQVVPALAKRGIPLSDCCSEGPACIGEVEVSFTGKRERRRLDKIHPFLQRIFQPDWKDYDWAELRGTGGCDGFHFPRESNWDGGDCKTNRYNYELAVQSFLIIVKKHLEDDLAVWSDARRWWWHVPEDICQEVLGYGPGLIVPERSWETTEQLADGHAKIEEHRRMLAAIALPAKRMADRIHWYDDDDVLRELDEFLGDDEAPCLARWDHLGDEG